MKEKECQKNIKIKWIYIVFYIFFLGCELLGKKIYCFGGAARDLNSATPDFSDSFYNDHYVLDLTNFNTDQDVNKLVNNLKLKT